MTLFRSQARAPSLRYSNALNFPFKHDARLRLHTFTHVLAQRFYVGAACATEIEEAVAMLFRNLRRAFREATDDCFIDPTPGLVPIRVLQGGDASAGPQGATGLTSWRGKGGKYVSL